MSKITNSLTCGKCGSRLFQFEEKPNQFVYQYLCCGQNFRSEYFLPLRYKEEEAACFKVGDSVRVVNFGQQYTTYSDWFEENNIGINLPRVIVIMYRVKKIKFIRFLLMDHIVFIQACYI